MLTRAEIMLQSAQSELSTDTQNLLEKFAAFENRYPKIWANIEETLYSKTDLNFADLINLLQAFSEITS